MAEFCKDCAKTVLKMSDAELDRAIMSKELDLCEGCGQYKPVVVRIPPRPTLGQIVRKLIRR